MAKVRMIAKNCSSTSLFGCIKEFFANKATSLIKPHKNYCVGHMGLAKLMRFHCIITICYITSTYNNYSDSNDIRYSVCASIFVALKTACFQIKDIEHEGWLTKQGEHG